jgi:hypothetical protein
VAGGVERLVEAALHSQPCCLMPTTRERTITPIQRC